MPAVPSPDPTATRAQLERGQRMVELLKQGITPHKIALAVVLGALLGMAPVLGTTLISCTIAALALRLNLVLIQIANNLVYPLQLLLLIPFVQAGQRLFGQPPMPLSAGQIVDPSKPVFTVADLSTVWVPLQVPDVTVTL